MFNFQAGVGILNPSDINSFHGQGSMDTSDQDQGSASQDTLDGLDGKRLFSLSHYLKHFLLILYCINELSSMSTEVINAIIPVLWSLFITGANKKMVT